MRGRRVIEIGVVQHGAVLVERDDVGVGQLVVGLARGGEISHVDAELRLARAERGLGRAMRARADLAGDAHHRKLVLRLVRAVIVQVIEQRLRIVRQVRADAGIVVADDRAARGILRQMLRGFGRLADDHDVEMLDPVAGRRVRHDVPVVVRLQIHELRLRARRVHEPRARRLRHRHPVLEPRIHRERIRLVVEELVARRAGRDDEMIASGARERRVGA